MVKIKVISYRFAVRLGHFSQSGVANAPSKIQMRHRQMKLFETSYNLLEEINALNQSQDCFVGKEDGDMSTLPSQSSGFTRGEQHATMRLNYFSHTEHLQ